MSAPTEVQFYDRFEPVVPASVVSSGQKATITVTPTLDGETVSFAETTGPSAIELQVQGPQLKLEPDDIVGVYPAPASEESPDEFLPHIALSRRTLPWEREGPLGGAPWLALLLVNASERSPRAQAGGVVFEATTVSAIEARDLKTFNVLTGAEGLNLKKPTPIFAVHVPNGLMSAILPNAKDIPLLCHVKRTVTDGIEHHAAIVIGNRLPSAGPANSKPQEHTAFLVSLERRGDLYEGGRFADQSKRTTLIVLHYWSFTPSTEGDFETVIQAIRVRPNGGVLRFGNLPQRPRQGETAPLSGGFKALVDPDGFALTPLPTDQPGDAVYRGPIRPFPPPARTKGFAIRAAPEEFLNAAPGSPLDYSHAAAFEIGRLLALADAGTLEDLRDVCRVMIPDGLPDLVAIDKIPPIFQKPDWHVNPEWYADPWSMPQKALIKPELELLKQGMADFTGISKQSTEWKAAVVTQLQQLGTAVESPVLDLNIDTVTDELLTNEFGEVIAAGTL